MKPRFTIDGMGRVGIALPNPEGADESYGDPYVICKLKDMQAAREARIWIREAFLQGEAWGYQSMHRFLEQQTEKESANAPT